MTGKSLLWRMSEFVSENQPDDVRPLQFYERNADYILAVDEVCAELPDLLRRFKADYRKGLYPNMQKEMLRQESNHRFVDPLLVIAAGQFDAIRIGRRYEPKHWQDYPVFFFEKNGEIFFFDPYILDDFKLWPLILKGFYEEPPFETLRKVGKYAHPMVEED